MQQRNGVRGPVRLILAVVAVTALATQLTACSGDSSPSDTASKAASAVSKAASAVSEAGDALASATAEAGRKFDELKNAVDAKGDVKLDGTTSTDSDGHATVKLTATNPTSSTKSYVVQVDFEDQSGNRLDTTVVSVDDIAGGASKDATATSNRALTGDVKTVVARAVRH